MTDLKKFTVLVVDDDLDLQELMSSIFEEQGFTVLSANSGLSAFELVKVNKIDVVVSDMRMPGGDGLSLLEKIRAYDPEIPVVIFVTGYSDVSISDCITKGAKTVFQKPFNQKDLINSVMSTLGLSTDL